MEFNFYIALGLFVASTILDAVFALYTISVIKSKARSAASLSAVSYVLQAVGIVSYVENKLYLIPLVLGAFTGSYFVVRWEASKKLKSTTATATELQ